MTLLSPPVRFPRLRAVDVQHHRQNGQHYYLLRDPLLLREGTLMVPQALGPLLMLCDGTIEDEAAMGEAVLLRYGARVDAALIRELLQALDQACLLENERTRAAVDAKRRAFRNRAFRPPALAGLSYAAEPETLKRQLDDYAAMPSPPAPLRAAAAHRRSNGVPLRSSTNHAGIFSPHIDYPRGGPVYASAWTAVAEAARAADLVVMVGTDHFGDDLFTLTRQSYATPFGALPTATDIVDRLAAVLGEEDAFRGELRHATEHSLELVAVWLHHVRNGRPVDMIPILVGSLHAYYTDPGSPADDPAIAGFVRTLRNEIEGKRVFVVASGDLAHVGPAFGGAPLTTSARASVRQADAALLERLRAGDAEGFFRAIGDIRNRNNVCGTTPGYLALRLMGSVTGRITGYDACPTDEADASAVTIAGVAFEPA